MGHVTLMSKPGKDTIRKENYRSILVVTFLWWIQMQKSSEKHKSEKSPLHINLQVVNFQRRKRAFTCPITQGHTSGIHCHVRASSTSSSAFVYFTVQHCVEYTTAVSLFIACSLDASPCRPAVVWYYSTFQGTVL